MIVRIWHGRTPRKRADEYLAFLKERTLPDIRDTEGNLEVDILRRDEPDASHFVIVSRWDSEDSIRIFVGEDIRKSKYFPEDKTFLIELESEVQQYELVAKAP